MPAAHVDIGMQAYNPLVPQKNEVVIALSIEVPDKQQVISSTSHCSHGVTVVDEPLLPALETPQKLSRSRHFRALVSMSMCRAPLILCNHSICMMFNGHLALAAPISQPLPGSVPDSKASAMNFLRCVDMRQLIHEWG
jgi:hypothetical protein